MRLLFLKKTFFKLKNILGVKKKGQCLVFPFLYFPFFFLGGEGGGGYVAMWTNLQKARNLFFSFLSFFLLRS